MSRCERELKGARSEAAKFYPRLGKDEVRSRAATATEGARVSFVGEADHEHFGTFVGFGSKSTRADTRHPAWVDLSDAEMHSKGHWAWVRDYDRGRGAIYFDDSQFVRADPRMTKVFAILRKAVDRCFAP